MEIPCGNQTWQAGKSYMEPVLWENHRSSARGFSSKPLLITYMFTRNNIFKLYIYMYIYICIYFVSLYVLYIYIYIHLFVDNGSKTYHNSDNVGV